ncbi:hypothetical protein NDU88_004451 [Pleurodeles waltl]|uniref:Uncharacterized protein n=1 Tax=Pleurodeles waltl TaxID=8319 RepID=A0AAV7TRA9_PLEWA|nr:hypothetical protein NDU88_004451 [Pleurodeles waltl]
MRNAACATSTTRLFAAALRRSSYPALPACTPLLRAQRPEMRLRVCDTIFRRVPGGLEHGGVVRPGSNTGRVEDITGHGTSGSLVAWHGRRGLGQCGNADPGSTGGRGSCNCNLQLPQAKVPPK